MKQNSEFIFWANIFIVFVGLVVLYKLHGPITWTYYMDLLHGPITHVRNDSNVKPFF